ncbi:HNH endonuclease signature motif containing protein [Arthrobacter sp. H41]|uniref:HNH endonuclease signature motif containing protein n=1 Tax=Arthrobacter sp. H41 TaxID=1312978 RepID=UPI0004B0D681|nr:HNH endonuclease signature motif containing protein [Arthrobacter sp. H41]
MVIAPLERPVESETLLESMRSDLLDFGQEMAGNYLTLSRRDAVRTLVKIEEIAKLVDYLQVVAARAVQDQDIATVGERQAAGSLLARAVQSISEEPLRGISEGAFDGVSEGASGRLSAITSADAGQQNKASALPEFKDCADYLRARLGISRSEANRRLRLARNILPDTAGCGAATPAPMKTLGDAVSSGSVSGRAASIICDAVQRVQSFATPLQLDSMEHHLTRQAVESDEDILRVLARRWEGVLDQDGQEPTEKVLKARQGVFLKGRRNGLHFLEIGATDEQFEHLVTVMNTATNPRGKAGTGGNQEHSTGGGDSTERAAGGTGADTGPDDAGGHPANGTGYSSGGRGLSDGESDAGYDRPTRPQSLLDGLVSACKIALSTDGLPAAGGHRPQVMVTISYSDLVGEMERAGHAVFGQQISARSIRKLACDADIIPLVLGGQGQILDIGRAQRLFPAHMRRGLVARDKGCAYPDCSIPATWCEAHHIVPWAKGGTTSITDGVLLCSRHHHVIHEGNWIVESRQGIPWFKPPEYLDPARAPRRNKFWQVDEAVHGQLLHHERCLPTFPG